MCTRSAHDNDTWGGTRSGASESVEQRRVAYDDAHLASGEGLGQLDLHANYLRRSLIRMHCRLDLEFLAGPDLRRTYPGTVERGRHASGDLLHRQVQARYFRLLQRVVVQVSEPVVDIQSRTDCPRPRIGRRHDAFHAHRRLALDAEFAAHTEAHLVGRSV